MKLTVLVDNNTYIGENLYGEPALCMHLDIEGEQFLFDTGYSHIFTLNAEKLGIDLSRVDLVVLSHGHDDHTKGLPYFFEECKPEIVVLSHPDAWYEKRVDGKKAGAPYTLEEMKEECDLRLTKRPLEIVNGLTFLGEIPRVMEFEQGIAVGERKVNDTWEPDTLKEDTALVYKSQKEDGIYIITGCSHSGICNIAEYAKKVCKCDKILGIIGGFHMFKLDERLERTIQYLKDNHVQNLYPCHCTNFRVKARMAQELPIHEAAVGFTTEWI